MFRKPKGIESIGDMYRKPEGIGTCPRNESLRSTYDLVNLEYARMP
jgi:hypothetical protein